MEIRALRPTDNRANFRCGDPHLDLYFKHYATKDPYGAHLGVPFVAVASRWVIGYASVAPAHLILKDQSRPVLRMARLGVDLSARGQGVGAQLLRFVLLASVAMDQAGVVVDASNPDYFARFGFTPFELQEGHSGDRPLPTPMFLPTHTIRAAMN